MKKIVSIPAFFAILFFASCKKDVLSDTSVQRPNLGAQAAQSFATIEIRNATTTGEFAVDSIYLFSLGITGGKFPVAKNEETITYSSYFGKQPVYIAVRGCLGKTIRITDTERKQHTKNIDVAEPTIVPFDEVSILEGSSVLITFEDTGSQY